MSTSISQQGVIDNDNTNGNHWQFLANAFLDQLTESTAITGAVDFLRIRGYITRPGQTSAGVKELLLQYEQAGKTAPWRRRAAETIPSPPGPSRTPAPSKPQGIYSRGAHPSVRLDQLKAGAYYRTHSYEGSPGMRNHQPSPVVAHGGGSRLSMGGSTPSVKRQNHDTSKAHGSI